MSIAEIFLTKQTAPPVRRTARGCAAASTPEMASGQLWLVEAPAHGAPSAPARHAVDRANVVVYDRALARQLEFSLPLGTYAERAPEADGPGDPAAERCVRFARDGWSVARLLPPRLPRRERAGRVGDFVAALAAAKAPGGLAVTVLAEGADGITERTDTRLDLLVGTVATYARDIRLAIVITAFAGASPAPASVANGLAG